MAPSRSGASLLVRKMAVGPSAPPMMAIEPAALSRRSGFAGSISPSQVNLLPTSTAVIRVPKMPIWADAPKSISFGRLISDEKSVIAPMPRKIKGG